MLVRFEDSHLLELYTTGKGREQYPDEVVNAFIKRVKTIQVAQDERDLRAMKSWRFEKLKGHENRYSMRLNKAWRMEFRLEKTADGKTVVIIEINNHYGD